MVAVTRSPSRSRENRASPTTIQKQEQTNFAPNTTHGRSHSTEQTLLTADAAIARMRLDHADVIFASEVPLDRWG